MRKLLNVSAIAVSLFMILLLVVCLISLMTGFVPFLSQSASTCGMVRMGKITEEVEGQISQQFNNLAVLSNELEAAESKEAVVSYLRSYIGSEEFGDLQFVCQGQTYSESGAEIKDGPALGVPTGSQMGVSKVKYYPLGQTRCISLYLPVRSSLYIDGLISIIPAQQLLDLKPYQEPPTSVLAVVSRNGDTISAVTGKDFPLNVGPDFMETFKTFSQSKDTALELGKMLKTTAMQSQQLTVGATKYTVTVAPLATASSELFLVDISPSMRLVSEQRSYIQQAIVIAVLAMLALLISALYLIFAKHKTKIVKVAAPAAAAAPAVDLGPDFASHVQTNVKAAVDVGASSAAPPHSCPTADAFASQCSQVLNKVSFQKRYMICAEIEDFAQIEKRMGVDLANNVLFHVEKVLSSICKENEFFCYGGAGCFYTMLRCGSTEDVRTRMQLLKDLARQNRSKAKINLKIGVFQLVKNGAVKEMMNNAALAKNMVRNNTVGPYVLYSQELVAEQQNNQKIEREMEEALKTGEFKLFLQPKYNVEKDRIDSAEALVRWFDPRKNDYIFPGGFIPLFESNGFIIKLDHFMYMEVLEYFEAAAKKGDKVYPICVNVSRVTALQPDFLNFYVSKKKHFNIEDGFLTLEFAESFVAQNVDLMKTLIPSLNENGIRVSVDNFTSGGGTIGILKKLPVNEVNIDRSFLFPGVSPEQDLALQKTLVATAKSFGIRVVQSGVENKELFDRCCDAGSDLIQGYYFARAISLEEYRIFINTNTSIRYKAVVK